MLVEPVPLATTWRWIEDNAQRLGAEEVSLAAVRGRVPATSMVASADVPATSRAIADGYAVRAEETIGAAPYNPLSCPVTVSGEGPLPPGTIAWIEAGQTLPTGADAVLPSEAVEREADGRITVVAPLAAGDGVAMAASEARAGDSLWPVVGPRQPLRPAEIGLLSAAGVLSMPVVRRPRTRILVAGTWGALETVGPMLHALVERDGGAVIEVERLPGMQLPAADLVVGSDVVLIVGSRDPIGAIVADGAETTIRGVAIEPGRETCLARLDGAIIAGLPGLSAACFWSYELVVGCVIRCRGGRDPGFPFVSRRFRTTRKIASALGVTEVVPVRIDASDPDAVVPYPNGLVPRLRNAASADGFALVPATSEGFPSGSELEVWLVGPVLEKAPGHG